MWQYCTDINTNIVTIPKILFTPSEDSDLRRNAILSKYCPYSAMGPAWPGTVELPMLCSPQLNPVYKAYGGGSFQDEAIQFCTAATLKAYLIGIIKILKLQDSVWKYMGTFQHETLPQRTMECSDLVGDCCAQNSTKTRTYMSPPPWWWVETIPRTREQNSNFVRSFPI